MYKSFEFMAAPCSRRACWLNASCIIHVWNKKMGTAEFTDLDQITKILNMDAGNPDSTYLKTFLNYIDPQRNKGMITTCTPHPTCIRCIYALIATFIPAALQLFNECTYVYGQKTSEEISHSSNSFWKSIDSSYGTCITRSYPCTRSNVPFEE